MIGKLTPEVVEAVNALVESGAKAVLSVHGVPLEAFVNARALSLWTPVDRAPYLSAEKRAGEDTFDIYSVALPASAKPLDELIDDVTADDEPFDRETEGRAPYALDGRSENSRGL